MSSLFLDLRGDPIPYDQVLGYGASAVVVLRDGVAVKTPLRYPWSSDADVRVNMEALQREQDVYRRLQTSQRNQYEGIVSCVGFTGEATQLAYMTNGDLRTYLENNRPSYHLQLLWALQMARALVYIHDRHVLVTDIASRNMLLDFELCLKFCDFSEASVLPLDANMDAVDDNGYTTRIDIGQLGAVIYEIVTGKRCEIDLFKDNLPTDGRAVWPERKFLPSTEGIWLGSIIEGCWVDGGFRSAKSLVRALELIEQAHSPCSKPRSQSGEFPLTGFNIIKDTIRERPITITVAILGTLGLLSLWTKRVCMEKKL